MELPPILYIVINLDKMLFLRNAIDLESKTDPQPPQAQRTLSSRDPSLTSSNSLPPPGHLTSPILSNLFDRLKTLPSGTTPGSVYKEYGMDPEVMRRLRRWVNSPSIGEEVTSVEEGEKKVELRAVWVDGTQEGVKRVVGR